MKIRRGEFNSLTKASFRQIGSCPAKFFKERSEQVLKNEISLKELLQESEVANKIAKTETKIVNCAGSVDDLSSLKKKFPDKFRPDIVEQFVGAEISGKKKNVQGQRLQNYMKSVKLGIEFKESVLLKTFENWSELNIERLQGYDVIVINVCKANMEYVKYWIDTLSTACTVKDYFSAILVLKSESELMEVYKTLECWKDNPDFSIHQCLFKKEKSVPNVEKVNENIVFSVIFGKVNVFVGQILSLNDLISKDLIKVVYQLPPPAGKIAYVSSCDKKIVKIHINDERSKKPTDVQVTYFVTGAELPHYQKKFLLHATDADLLEPESEESNEKEDELDATDEEESDEDEYDLTEQSASELEKTQMSRQASTSYC